MLKIRKIIVVMLIIFLLSSFYLYCYATFIPLTKENLDKSFQGYIKADANAINCKNVSVSDKNITVNLNGTNYTVNYDLNSKPTFSLEFPIQKGMSYEEFNKQIDNFNAIPIMIYSVVANIQGIEYADSTIYYSLSLAGHALNEPVFDRNLYTVIDDTKLSDGVTINKDESNSNIIYASDFGNKVIEYINSIYKDKHIIVDSGEDEINSYELIIEKKDVTNTSCKLTAELKINTGADFSKIADNTTDIEDWFNNIDTTNKNITEENADYCIKLKVGQKCNIESVNEITGYELYGNEFVSISNSNDEITAKKVGKTNGYFYIGNMKKSIYIIVEDNKENKILDTITLNVDNENVNNSQEQGKNPENTNPVNNIQQPNKTEDKKEEIKNSNANSIEKLPTDSTISKDNLPKTGTTNTIYLLVVCIIIAIRVIIKIRKYKDIT